MRLKEIQLNSKELRDYVDLVGYEKDQTLTDLREVTRSLGDASIMQIGSSQGKLIEIICRLGNFSKCIEIGVFTGYSSICIAKGMVDHGKLYAIDPSEQYTKIAREFWKKAGVDNKIELILSKGNEVLDDFINRGQKGEYDFVFIDADKANYIDYYEKSMLLIKSGGLIMVDNTVWKGKVLDPNDQSQSTATIKKLNDTIASDKRVRHCMLTMYDGMTICQKK